MSKIKDARASLLPAAKPAVKLAKLDKSPIKAWSLSLVKNYEQCPLQVRLEKVEKLGRPPKGPALIRGDDIHKKAEKFVLTGGALPAELKPVTDKFKWLRGEYQKRRVSVEGEIAFDKDWNKVEWFAGNAWLRVKADAIHMPKDEDEPVRIIDYKTGKVAEGAYDDQLELYGASALLLGLGTTAIGELWFTDHNVIIPSEDVMQLKDLPKIQKRWVTRVKPLFSDLRFSPRPGGHCRWCPWARSKGGPCQY